MAKHLAQKNNPLVVSDGCYTMLFCHAGLMNSCSPYPCLSLLIINTPQLEVTCGGQTVTLHTLEPTTAGTSVKLLHAFPFFQCTGQLVTQTLPTLVIHFQPCDISLCCPCSFNMPLQEREKATINTCWTRCLFHPFSWMHLVDVQGHLVSVILWAVPTISAISYSSEAPELLNLRVPFDLITATWWL